MPRSSNCDLPDRGAFMRRLRSVPPIYVGPPTERCVLEYRLHKLRSDVREEKALSGPAETDLSTFPVRTFAGHVEVFVVSSRYERLMKDWTAAVEELPLEYGTPELSGPPMESGRTRGLPDISLFGGNRMRRNHDLCSHLVQDQAITDSDCMAVRCGLLSLSYWDLQAAMVQRARRLRGLGVRSGDNVIIVAESGFQAVALILALAELKACILAVSARTPESKLTTIRSSNVHHRMIYCVGDSSAAAEHAKLELFHSEFSLLGPVIVQDVAQTRSAAGKRKRRPTISFAESDGCTSLGHRGLLESASYLAGACALSANDVIYNYIPIFTIEGFLATLAALHAGAGVELVAEPTPEHFVWTLHEGRLSCLIASPPILLEILAYAKINGHVLRHRRLRLISLVGQAIDPVLEMGVLDVLGNRIRRFGFHAAQTGDYSS